MVTIALLHVYHLALCFAPTQSVIRRTFEHRSGQLSSLLPKACSNWSAETHHRLEGHNDKVRAVAFSLHGEVEASALVDKRVRLWNARAGEETQKFEGHNRWGTAVAISPNVEVMASGPYGRTVWL